MIDLRDKAMKQTTEKLNQQLGFSLAETLVAILILLMVSAVVAGGVPAASNAYSKAVDAANAQVLLSTAATALRDELGTAKKVNISTDGTDGKTVRYYSADNGNYSELSMGETDDRRPVILLTSYLGHKIEDPVSDDSDDSGDTTAFGAKTVQWELVSQAAITKKLGLTYDDVSYNDGIITFTGLSVLKNSNENVLATLDTLKIKVVSMA